MKVDKDYVAAKLRGLPVKGVRIAILNSMEIDVWRGKKVRRCCSAANGMSLLVIVSHFVAVVITTVRYLISSELDCRWCLDESETNL